MDGVHGRAGDSAHDVSLRQREVPVQIFRTEKFLKKIVISYSFFLYGRSNAMAASGLMHHLIVIPEKNGSWKFISGHFVPRRFTITTAKPFPNP
jgi:hypothetical protein